MPPIPKVEGRRVLELAGTYCAFAAWMGTILRPRLLLQSIGLHLQSPGHSRSCFGTSSGHSGSCFLFRGGVWDFPGIVSGRFRGHSRGCFETVGPFPNALLPSYFQAKPVSQAASGRSLGLAPGASSWAAPGSSLGQCKLGRPMHYLCNVCHMCE